MGQFIQHMLYGAEKKFKPRPAFGTTFSSTEPIAIQWVPSFCFASSTRACVLLVYFCSFFLRRGILFRIINCMCGMCHADKVTVAGI